MGWQLTVVFNLIIAMSYLVIATIILRGLVSTHQLGSNPLALATAAIFMSCAAHHAHHAAHVLVPLDETPAQLAALRSTFGEWHSWALDAVGAVIALTYLALRRFYGALLNTPAMFEDAVRVAAEDRLREMAFTDPLTGCGNRAALELLARHDARIELTVLYLDLDDFKGVNDRYGHEVGDRLLASVGRELREGLPEASVFRLGGDEFVVVLEGPSPGVAARCRELVRRPVDLREGVLYASASVGQAAGTSHVEQLLREADMQMYADKRRLHDHPDVTPHPKVRNVLPDPYAPALSRRR